MSLSMLFVVHIDTSLSILYRVDPIDGWHVSCRSLIDEPGLQANNLAYRELGNPLSSPQMLRGLETISTCNYALPISVGESFIR
jgi:hypothetical protein